jgi:type IV pilus assembly protein PilM
MALGGAYWGIDLGQCALKAMRCTLADDGETLVVDAYDYIEYPKILTQPEAEPAKLIREALDQFLSRNTVKHDKVAISVSGQSGLTRFFTPPPVDAKKIPDIVKYEAKQQIPFDLEEVVWDYQQMGGGNEVDGFALETEVGLFAMKRDQVFRAIMPYDDAGVELDIVQLAPISIYNYAAYDVLGELTGDYDPEKPPESTVIISMGTDTTDLVITNGYRVWQRSIPLGGNHFTRQLSKELKLTFAKAEHLKKNARQAEDPKKIFQAMRPVFNDMVREVQASLRFFHNIDKKAKLGKFVLIGNASKLPGLRQYLSKNLDTPIDELTAYNRLQGASNLNSPSFKENVPSFAVCYGLCVQAAGQAALRTSLLPQQILVQRMVKEKKPWAVAGAGALILACAVNFFFWYGGWREVHTDNWSNVEQAADSLSTQSNTYFDTDQAKEKTREQLLAIGTELVGSDDRRLLWLELLQAVNVSLPREAGADERVIPSPKDRPFQVRKDIHVEYLESQYFPDLATWFNSEVKKKYEEGIGGSPAADADAAEEDAPATDPPTDPPPANPAPAVTDVAGDEEAADGPSGPGWVIEIKGYHFYNENPATEGRRHVQKTILRELENGEVELPTPSGDLVKFKMKELGIQYPLLLISEPIRRDELDNPNVEGSGGGREGGIDNAGTQIDPENPPTYPVKRYDFTIQFCWTAKTLKERLKEREDKERLEKAQQEQENSQNLTSTPSPGGRV